MVAAESLANTRRMRRQNKTQKVNPTPVFPNKFTEAARILYHYFLNDRNKHRLKVRQSQL